ncbi:porin [Variovorax sp. GT1P44]|uniref:porin n=1 Tax=Variovorax sp. GT1P44 TaxID=3443742 RepID=UPI003F46D869
MRKLALVAFTSMLLASGAFAQITGVVQSPPTGSSVTLFGVADAALSYGTGSVTSTTQVVSGANTSSRLGFRGVEDLGGGLAAGFWLEAGVTMDTGAGGSTNINNQPDGGLGTGGLMFNRRSTVSLIDRWGEIRMGRDFSATYRNRDQTDPFATNGAGASQPYVGSIAGTTATRVSNMVGYYLPATLGGFFGEVQYFMGENVHSSPIDNPASNAGNGYALRIGYVSGPLGIAVSTGKTSYVKTASAGDIPVVNVGASYDFDVVKVTAGYFHDKVEQFIPVTGTGYIVGAVIPVFKFDQLKLSYSEYGTDAVGDPQARKFAIGYVYNFSKRTAAYATFATIRNSGGSAFALNGSTTAPNRNSQGYDLGLKHSF